MKVLYTLTELTEKFHQKHNNKIVSSEVLIERNARSQKMR